MVDQKLSIIDKSHSCKWSLVRLRSGGKYIYKA